MTKHFYAAHNTKADLREGVRGFINTWEVLRFKTRELRDEFVDKMSNVLAKPMTRKEAAEIYAAGFRCEGKPVPTGGLFGHRRDTPFWNEM